MRLFRHYFFHKKITIAKWKFNLFGMFMLLLGIITGGYLLTFKIFPQVFALDDDPYTWNFLTAGNYTLSDSDQLEIASSTVRFKTRNYANDSNTGLLYHLNQSAGSSVTDSSSNGNTGTHTDGTWDTGNLDEALTFNGTSSRITASDSASISFNQSHSLEIWTKFASAFSSGSHPRRQTLIDKGDYQLYYDNDTGKVVYEFVKEDALTWEQKGGDSLNRSWNRGVRSSNCSAVIGSNIYVGTGNANAAAYAGDAEVWLWNGSSWTQIGGDGLNSGWGTDHDEVLTLLVDGSTLYAGLGDTGGDSEIWSWNGSSWTKIGGDGLGGGWGSEANDVYSLATYDSKLYAGLGRGGDNGEVWEYNGSTWTRIAGNGAAAGYQAWGNSDDIEDVYSLVADSSYLYAGLGHSTDDGEVWRFNGSTWEQIAGNGAAGGFNSWTGADNIESVYSLATDGTNLYAGLGYSTDDGEVWQFNGSTWSQIAGNGAGSSWDGAVTNIEAVYSLHYSGSTLYAGLGLSDDDAEVWQYSAGTWSQIGGHGLNSSWDDTTNMERVKTLLVSGSDLYAGLYAGDQDGEFWKYSSGSWSQIGGGHLNDSWGKANQDRVNDLTVVDGKLYAGLGQGLGEATVWEYNDSTWDLVGGQGLNSSWTFDTYEYAFSLVGYEGDLYAGLGSSTDDGEVWKYSGGSWLQVGGDGLNSGWADGDNIESVYSLAVDETYLYAGTGASNDDADVWRYNGLTWEQIGGAGSAYGGWGASDNANYTMAMIADDDYLYAGLGNEEDEGDVWMWNKTDTWTQIAGNGADSGYQAWDGDDDIDEVLSFAFYDFKLYAGLGNDAGNGEVWEWNGSTWTKMGGDALNSSWTDAVYERVRTLTTYNGYLFAGLGSSGGDGEVWRYDGTSWLQVGGDSLNEGWTTALDDIYGATVYRGKLYVGAGNGNMTDHQVWAYGDNVYLESTTASQDTNWHHIAASYNGSVARLYVDGSEEDSESMATFLNDSDRGLLIGAAHGSNMGGIDQGYFAGTIDEIRLSDTARTSFVTKPYATSQMTARPASAVHTSQVKSWDSFSATETLDGGTINYRLSADGGTTWQYWTGSAWATSSSLNNANSESDVNTNISTFPVTTGGFMWQSVFSGNGDQRVTLNSVTLDVTPDTTAPTNPTATTAVNEAGGSTSLTSGNWYPYSAPVFTWTGATDTGGSGVEGYFVYFGTTSTASPTTQGSFQTGTSYTPSSITSGETYYLRIQTRDNAQNVNATVYDGFTYKFDDTPPTNMSIISVSPSGYSGDNEFTFFWPSSGSAGASDAGSGIAGYQYKTDATTGDYSDWSTMITDTSVTLTNIAHQSGENVFLLRTIDNTGNVALSSSQVNFYYSGDAPTAPLNITATPEENTTNSFAFSWDAPEYFLGEASTLTYCYTINSIPLESTCNWTEAAVTSLVADAYANQPGINIFYMVAKDGIGNVNYDIYDYITFRADTTAPGIPLTVEIADVSVKATSSWKLAISWEEPANAGAGISSYQVYSSTDGVTYSLAATAYGIAYVDTRLTQVTHYYKIKACDSVNNCGAFSSAVSLYPDGRYTEAADLASGPSVSGITTKRAKISWSTGRTCDSKVQYGKSSNDYYDEEPSNSEHVTDHEINLTSLDPGTRYYYKTKWTDEDGNTGTSTEKTFKTDPAPTVKDVEAKNIGISSAILEFTTKGASSVKIYYGQSTDFGGLKEIATSTAESTYTAELSGLLDGTKYYYKINLFDEEEDEYEGTILDFETLPRPRISDVKIQQVKGTAQPTVYVTWTSNTEISSIITYYPEGNSGDVRDEVNVELISGNHSMVIRGLIPQTKYTLIVKGRDKIGNEAESEAHSFTTATDTRPPQISNLTVEGASIPPTKREGEVNIQLLVSWDTDEPATSQVEYGEGTGTTYSQKTQEDSNATFNHMVIISGLTPSKVYHLRAISKDEADNTSKSIDTVTISPKATDSAFDLVISNLQELFGFAVKKQ